MKSRFALFGLALAGLTVPVASAVVLDCTAKGALEDNFSTWSGGHATASVVEDDGHRFLRIESDPTKGVVQYRGCRVDGAFPGFYRLRIKARSRGDGFEVALRQDKPPYRRLATALFSAPDWTEREYFLAAKESKEPPSVYVYLGSGSYDLESISVEAVQREELVKRYRRPPETVDELLIPTRFPLGLPQGWTIGSQCCRTTTEARDGNLVVRSNGDAQTMLYTSPFQTNRPDTNHWVNVVYRAKGKWSYVFVDDRNKVCGATTSLPNTDTFARSRTLKWVPGLTSALTLLFRGEGELELKELHVIPEGRTVAAEKPTAALRFRGGAAGDATRIVFEDESPAFDWKVVPAPDGARVRFSLTDVYGRTRPAGEEPVSEAGGTVRGLDLPTLGAYRLQMDVVGRDGATRTATECVFCRVRRPVGWGRDLPDSPFGIHVAPREDHVRLAKACGVNWTRLHDAGTELTGWWALEAEKGKWTFHDDLVDVYRRNGIKILAQLGTSPRWASHYHDLDRKPGWYFERYLRPTNATDYVNYVTRTVRRYRGKIDEYFFWNEPWGGWWSTAVDIKFFDKDRAAEDYAAFQKLSYDAVKAVDPSIRFVGLNSNAFDNGAKWSERVTAAGGLAACDAADYHYYTGILRAKRTSVDTLRKAFGTVMARHPKLDGRGVYMTEGGAHNNGSVTHPEHVSGLYRVLVPWEPETPEVWALRAARTVRFSLSMLAEGNERIFLYGIHCHTALGVMPSFAMLVGADGGPSPESAAFSQFARALEGRRIVSKENYGERGLVFAFGDKTGGRPGILRVYTDLQPAEARALACRAACLDLYGNPTDGTHPTDESVLYELPSASDRLAISFSIWALYDMVPGGTFADPVKTMEGLKERGYNAIRLDDGAGLYAAPDGTPRGKVRIHPMFGEYSRKIRQQPVSEVREMDMRENLVRFCRAADACGMKVILSSWYYLHTNWMTDEAINAQLFEGLSVEQKMSYFTDELCRILAILRENKLDRCVAFAELFNEFDGLYFVGDYGKIKDPEKAARLRSLHEAAITRLKREHPGVKIAYDVWSPRTQKSLVPRNADVLNFHHYYYWNLYHDFEQGAVRRAVEEIPIPDGVRPYLVSSPPSIADITATRCGNLRVGNDWNPRVRLYAALDETKIPEIERRLSDVFEKKRASYLQALRDGIAQIRKIRDEVLPGVPLVMGEGGSYCAANALQFEEHSDSFWAMLREQAKILREEGVWGAVPRTTSGPEDPSWDMRPHDLRRVNDLFRLGEQELAPSCAAQDRCDVTVDFDRACGAVRRLNGVCNGLPLVLKSNQVLNEQFAALEVAGIRFHDQASRNNGLALVDISRIFPLAHADENDPRNYIFDQTDDYIASCRTFTDAIEFRIGEQIEHFERHYRIRPPADYDKYARICLNIVRHYNDGWANGFRWNIRRWAVWEEPDNRRLFDGDYQREYLPLYAKIAVALKSAYPDLKVGGPQTRGREMFRIEQFVSYCKDHGLPLDFCGVTEYRRSVDRFLEVGAEARRILDAYGYGKTEVELSEWHCEPVSWSAGTPEQAKAYRESLTGSESAAFSAALLAAGQDSAYDRMFFYATDIGSWAIFDFTLKTRHPVWSAFKAFADTARLQHRVETSADKKRGFYALATRGESGAGALMLAALRTAGTESVRVRVKGGLVPGEVLLENGGEGRLSPVDGWTFSDGVLTLPAVGRNAIWFVGFGGYRARRLASCSDLAARNQ